MGFLNIRIMGTIGSDTLVILDGRQRRTTLFHPEVGFLRVMVLPEEAGVAMPSNGMFGDGSIVFGGLINWDRGDDTPTAGYERLTNPFYSVSLDGSEIMDFGEFPGTEGHLEAQLEEMLAGLPSPDMAPQIRASFEDRRHAETMPAFGDLLLDSEGFLWVEDYNIPGDTHHTWTVFDEEGAVKTRLSLPIENRVLDIGE